MLVMMVSAEEGRFERYEYKLGLYQVLLSCLLCGNISMGMLECTATLFAQGLVHPSPEVCCWFLFFHPQKMTELVAADIKIVLARKCRVQLICTSHCTTTANPHRCS